jgi:hypothetical protein
MTPHVLAETRILTETTCFACAGKGWVPDKDTVRKPGHVWDCPTCNGKKVTHRAVSLAELRDALQWAPGRAETNAAKDIDKLRDALGCDMEDVSWSDLTLRAYDLQKRVKTAETERDTAVDNWNRHYISFVEANRMRAVVDAARKMIVDRYENGDPDRAAHKKAVRDALADLDGPEPIV